MVTLGDVLLRDAQLDRLQGIHDQPSVVPERLFQHKPTFDLGYIEWHVLQPLGEGPPQPRHAGERDALITSILSCI